MTDPGRQLWVSEAGFDEQGSFCDTESGHHYENRDNFSTQAAIRQAEETGTEAIVMDAPADRDDSYGMDQRFNLHRTEEDGQGIYTEAKYEPGR